MCMDPLILLTFFLIITPAYAFSSYAQFTLPKHVTCLLQSVSLLGEDWGNLSEQKYMVTDVNDVTAKMQAW